MSWRPRPTIGATYGSIYDASGSAAVLDMAVQHLARGGEIVLAGFYATPLTLGFPPAFMREARFRVAAEWRQPDMAAVLDLISVGPVEPRRASPPIAVRPRRRPKPTAPPSTTRPA